MEKTFVELFCGIGGFRLGLERSGWRCLWANDNDKSACRIYRKNFGDKELVEKDIEEIEIETIPDHTLLTAGFPCQDLSVAGKRRGLGGERSALFWEIVRVAKAKRSPLLLLENVPGLLSSNERKDFGIVLASLEECGYGLAARVLDSQYFGVAQRRRRVFIVGCLGRPCPPEILFEQGTKLAMDEETPARRDNKAVCVGWDGGLTYERLSQCVATKINPDRVREASGIPGRVDVPVYHISRGQAKEKEIVPTIPAGEGPRRHGPGGTSNTDFTCVVGGALRSGGDGGIPSSRGENIVITGGDRSQGTTPATAGKICDVHSHKCPDSPRYRALGNAVTVNVIEWIGRRLTDDDGLAG